MDQTPPEKEINRIERKLQTDAAASTSKALAKTDKAQKPAKSRSLDAVMVAVVLLLAVSAALVVAGRLNEKQRIQLTAGTAGAAVGLLFGYGVGRLRP